MMPIDENLGNVIGLLQKKIWGSQTERRLFEDHGLKITPANFYSNLPTLAEIESSFEYKVEMPYIDHPIFPSFQDVSFLLQYSEKFPKSFFYREFHNDNDQFQGIDAIALFSMIGSKKPRKIIEIGSGFSTLVALEAIRIFELDTEVICIDPFPRPFVRKLNDVQLIEKPVQEIGLEYFQNNLEDGDFLFIDSTHTVKTGSDCLHLYLRILPLLTKELYFHAHDIFLPAGLPKEWLMNLHIYWTEQYLLLALLSDIKKYKFEFGSNFAHLTSPLEVAKLSGVEPVVLGGSFWWSSYS